MSRHSEQKRHKEKSVYEFREVILRRLILAADKEKSDNGLTRYQISRGNPDEGNKKIIPQSSTLHYTRDLEENWCIRRVSKSKLGTGKDRIVYDITVLGLIKWLHHLEHNRKDLDLTTIIIAITKSRRLLPFISDNWPKIREIFKSETMMASMLLSVSNMNINYYDSKYAGSLVSTSLKVGWLEIRITNQLEPPIPRKIKTELVDNARDTMVSELFTFVYLYTLDRQQPIQDKKHYNENRTKLFSLIKSHPSTYHSYLKFIKQLKKEVESASDYIKKVESDLET